MILSSCCCMRCNDLDNGEGIAGRTIHPVRGSNSYSQPQLFFCVLCVVLRLVAEHSWRYYPRLVCTNIRQAAKASEKKMIINNQHTTTQPCPSPSYDIILHSTTKQHRTPTPCPLRPLLLCIFYEASCASLNHHLLRNHQLLHLYRLPL